MVIIFLGMNKKQQKVSAKDEQLQAVRAVIHHRYGTSTISGSFVGFISGNLVAEREVILFPLCKLSVLLH